MQRLDGGGFELRGGDLKSIAKLNGATDIIELHSGVRIQKSVIPDLHEPGRKNVLQKPADEFHRVESHPAVPCAAWFSISKGHLGGFNLHDAIVRNRHLENIPGKVTNGLLGLAGRLDIDVPVFFSGFRRDQIKQPAFDHHVPEFGLVDL